MGSFKSKRGAGAFTLVELLCVIVIIGILAALLLPTLSQGKARAQRIECANHLKEMGLAFHAFMHDHNSRFPMQVPMREGGSWEFVRNGYRVDGEFYFSFRHFQCLSNELVEPKLLVCPMDARAPAISFAALKNGNISYFIGVNADFALPNSILAGDRNLTNDVFSSPTIVRAGYGRTYRWTEEMHRFKGNLLFADGRVEQTASLLLAGGDLFLPTVSQVASLNFPGAGGAGSGPQSGGPAAGQPAPAPSGLGPPGDGSGGTNSPKPEDGTAGQPPPPARGQSSHGSSSASTSIAVPPTAVAAASPTTRRPALETNPAPARIQGQPAPPAVPDSGVSPFARWFAETAEALVNKAKWLLYLLLLLLLLAVIAARLYRLSQRK